MKHVLGLAVVLALGAPLAAFANDGYVVADISLQAGPDTDYPPIENLSAGTEVDVQGCVEGFSWCDVIVGGDRGWVPGSFVETEYDNQPVFLVDYGPRIGIPLVSFSIGTYWDAHYHNRPFYAQRTEWVNRHISVRPPPRPAIAHAPPLPNHGPNRGAPAGHQQPAHEAAANTSRTTMQAQPEHHAPARDEQKTRNDTVNRTATEQNRTATEQRTAATPKAQPRVEEHAQPPKPAEHAPPKPAEHAPPKPAPKEEGKKEPEHKDDDHGH